MAVSGRYPPRSTASGKVDKDRRVTFTERDTSRRGGRSGGPVPAPPVVWVLYDLDLPGHPSGGSVSVVPCPVGPPYTRGTRLNVNRNLKVGVRVHWEVLTGVLGSVRVYYRSVREGTGPDTSLTGRRVPAYSPESGTRTPPEVQRRAPTPGLERTGARVGSVGVKGLRLLRSHLSVGDGVPRVVGGGR